MKAISGYFKGIWVPYLILSLSLTQNSLTGQKGEKGTKGRSGILGTRKQESRSKVVLTLRLRCSCQSFFSVKNSMRRRAGTGLTSGNPSQTN